MHAFNPTDLLDFIELPAFSKRWKALGLEDESDLTALQISIMVNPKCGKVIPGTTGLRKLRFSPERWAVGKQGGLRVLYVFFEEFGFVLLALVDDNRDEVDISEDVKQKLNVHIDEVLVEWRRRRTLSQKRGGRFHGEWGTERYRERFVGGV